MRYIRNISDDQNKSGDTDNIFRFNLLQDEDIFNFGDYPISINIANSSGYILSMVPEKEFGNSVLKLDFNDQSLKSLTPDNYLLEVEVKFPDGTTATFPTKGGMPFTVNSNLKNTAGHLVPTVTFDEVLNAVDKKVNNYLETVQKGNPGEKGEKGDPGVVDTTKDYTWTGTNTFNKKIIATAGVQGNADTATKLQTARKINGTNFDGTADINVNAANDSNLVHISGSETIIGNKTFNGNTTFNWNATFINAIYGKFKNRELANGTDLYTLIEPGYNYTSNSFQTSTFVNKPAEVVYGFGLVGIDITSYHAGGWATTQLLLFESTTGKIFTALLTSSGTGVVSVMKTWTKVAADDSLLVHNTGTETVNGDKTFTGNNTFTGKTSFWFKQIQWTSGIMQGTWYIQRMGNWVNAKFDMSANTATGTTTLTLPVGYRPLSTFVRELEQGGAGISKAGTVYVGQAYTDANAMTFSYPTNDPWPTA